MIRQKDPVAIRRDALRVGVQKAASDCYSCANSYFDLARENGATEEEIETALKRRFGAEYLTRRQALKRIAVGAASVAAVGAGLVPLEAAAVNSFGIDTNTVNCCGRIGPNFYIGRFGGETTSSTSGFDTTAAHQTPSYFYNYAYWNLAGMGWPGSGTDPYAWGQKQADAANSAWYNNPNAGLVYGITIFADIEGGQGWTSDQESNRDVLEGWLDRMVYHAFVPGVYISPGNWDSYFGSGYRAPRAFALWITSCHTCSISCQPGNPNCTGVAAQVENLWSTVGRTVLGGSAAVVWQYWVGGCAYGGDWDYSNQSCHSQINAVSDSSTYVCPGCGSGTPCP